MLHDFEELRSWRSDRRSTARHPRPGHRQEGPAERQSANALRFTEAIDMCAMRTGAGGTDDIWPKWRKADPIPVSDDLEAEVEKAFQDLDTKYDRERLVALVKAAEKKMSETAPVKDGPTVTQATQVKKAAPKSDYKPADVSPQRRVQRSFAIRLWSIAIAIARWFMRVLPTLSCCSTRFGKALATARRSPDQVRRKRVKGFMFDCACAASASCPRPAFVPENCPSSCATALRRRARNGNASRAGYACVWSRPGKARRTWSTTTRS